MGTVRADSAQGRGGMVAAGHEGAAAGDHVGTTGEEVVMAGDQLAALYPGSHPARLGHRTPRISRGANIQRVDIHGFRGSE